MNIVGPGLNQPKVSSPPAPQTRRALTLVVFQLSKSSGNCSSNKRRRTSATTVRASRRRQCTRSECSPTLTSSIFDQLPWISQVEIPPERVNVWDIADLSLIPDTSEKQPESGIGPVRRRKTSLLSRSDTAAHPHRSSSPLPLPQSILDRLEQDPRTPPPRVPFNPKEVKFRNLMPVVPSQDGGLAPSPRILAWSRPSSPIRR